MTTVIHTDSSQSMRIQLGNPKFETFTVGGAVREFPQCSNAPVYGITQNEATKTQRKQTNNHPKIRFLEGLKIVEGWVFPILLPSHYNLLFASLERTSSCISNLRYGSISKIGVQHCTTTPPTLKCQVATQTYHIQFCDQTFFFSKKKQHPSPQKGMSCNKKTSIDPRRFWIPCLRYFCHLNFCLSFGLHLRCGLGLLPTKEGGLHGWRISCLGPGKERNGVCVCVKNGKITRQAFLLEDLQMSRI